MGHWFESSAAHIYNALLDKEITSVIRVPEAESSIYWYPKVRPFQVQGGFMARRGRKPYSIYLRNGTYYAKLWNATTSTYSTKRSTGAHTRDEAIGVVTGWLHHGLESEDGKRPIAETLTLDTVLSGLRRLSLRPDEVGFIVDILKERSFLESATIRSDTGSTSFTHYLTTIWNYDKSPYVREKHLHGQRIGQRQCLEATRHIKYYRDYFGDAKRIGEVTKNDLRAFSLWLAEHPVRSWGRKSEQPETSTQQSVRRFSAGYINKVFLTGLVALKWAASHDEIQNDPGRGLMKFSGTTRLRGILTEDEVKKIFMVHWKHERSRVASLLAMTTGLRAGEVLGLRGVDIGNDRLYVKHSWSQTDGLKSTKTGKERVIPLLPEVRNALLSLFLSNPHGTEVENFIFYSLLPGKPMDLHFLLDGLVDVIHANGISEEERIRRNIVFHSWRHYFAAHMADRLDARIVQQATGHASSSMLEHYAAHELEETFQTLKTAASDIFRSVLKPAMT